MQNKKIILYIGIAFLLLTPKIILSMYNSTDPFIYSSLAVSQSSIETGKISHHPYENVNGTLQSQANGVSERSGLISLQVIFSQVLGIDLNALAILPFIGIIFSVLAIGLAKRFTNSLFAALCFAAVVSFDPTINKLSFNFFYIGIGFCLFFTFLILLQKTQDNSNSVKNMLLMIMVFLTSFLTYYMTELYIILILLVFSIVYFLALKLYNKTITKALGSIFILAIFFTGAFILLDPLFKSYFNRLIGPQIISSMLNFFSLTILGNNSASSYSNVALTSIGLSLYLLLTTIASIYAITNIVNMVKKRKNENANLNQKNILFFALLLSWPIIFILYLELSFASFKEFLLIFPLLGFYSLCQLKIKRWSLKKTRTLKVLIMLFITTLFMLKLGLWIQDPQIDYLNSIGNTAGPICTYIKIYMNSGNVLTDLDTAGKILFTTSTVDKTNQIYLHLFFDFNSGFLYQNNQKYLDYIFNKYHYNFLILPRFSIFKSMSGGNWVALKPIEQNYNNFDNYTSMNKLFDNFDFSIYQHE